MFEDDSLALKSLQSGQVDFHDPRVNLKMKNDLLEVDLGELQSFDKSTVHVSRAQTLEKGQVLTDSTQKFKLVMVGRQIKEDEALDLSSDHTLSSSIFHETNH